MKLNQLSLVCVAFIGSEQMWNKLQPLADKSISYYASTKNPESKDFWRKVTLRNSKIQSIVKDALTILGQSVLKGSIEESNNTAKRIKKLSTEISEAMVARIGAPDDHWNPLKKTKHKLDRQIQEDEKKIKEYQQGIRKLQQAALDNITGFGLNIPKETIEYLFMAPNGSTIARIISIGMNIKQMINLVEERFKAANTNDLQIAHTYAGLYFIGCRTRYEAYTIAVDEINNVFTPKLTEYEKKMKQAKQETIILLSQSSEENKEVVRDNLAKIEKNLMVIEKYGDYLKKHLEQLEQEKERQSEKMAIAVNTYKTVTASNQLIDLIRSSMIVDLEGMMNFQIPDPNLFCSDICKEEFDNLMKMLAEK